MKILLTSDTHGILKSPPNGDWDIFAHMGDVCPNWKWQSSDEWISQQWWIKDHLNPWLKSINTKRRLIIFGNHDMLPEDRIQDMLEDSAEFIHNKTITIGDEVIYGNGSSYNAFQLRNWGFGYPLNFEHPYVDDIPFDTTILLTHEPAYGILDCCQDGNIGSSILAEKIKTLPSLKLHAFGHVHESKGYQMNRFTSVNAACRWFEFDTESMEVEIL